MEQPNTNWFIEEIEKPDLKWFEKGWADGEEAEHGE